MLCLTWFMWNTDYCAKFDFYAPSESNIVVFFHGCVFAQTEEVFFNIYIYIYNNTHMHTFTVRITAILTCQQSLTRRHSCHRPPGNLQDMPCRPPHQIPESADGSFGLVAHVCASSRSAHPDTPPGMQETE